MRKYKLIIFDLDDTLTPAKSPADKEMIFLLKKLLDKYKVAIITWGKLETIKKQVVDMLEKENANLENLYILPTIWTQFYVFKDWDWQLIYKESLSENEVRKIKAVLEEALEKLNIKPKKTRGEIIENRWSQITYSALWQSAPLEEKKKFDPDKKIRKKIVEYIKDKLPDYEISIWWTTSIDITRKGFNKAYGIKKLLNYLQLDPKDVLFVGDAIFPWWNDRPAISTGVDYYKVENPEDTKKLIKKLITNKVVIIMSWPSGAWKTTLWENIKNDEELNIDKVITTTTRKPRQWEKNGVDYWFVDVEEFKKKIKNWQMIEWAQVHWNFYWSTYDELERILNSWKIPFYIVDPQWVETLSDVLSEKWFNVVTIFVVPPSEEELRKRLLKRWEDPDSEEFKLRLKESLNWLKLKDIFDYVIINDDLKEAVKKLKNIILQYK